MFWKKENKAEKKLEMMNELLRKSFANVKKDTSSIYQWLNYFYGKSMQQEQLISKLQLELFHMPKTREDIRRIIDEYYSFEGMMSKIRDIHSRVEYLEKKQAMPSQDFAGTARQPQREPRADLSHIEERLEKLEQKRVLIREKIMKRLTRNSKEYVKSVIISYIRKYERISALQLKDIIVEEQNLCSKSSFYRLLEEVEGIDELGVIKQGKEKHYVSKAVRRL